MASVPPLPGNAAGWDYLKDFTEAHEALVLHFYNNKTTADGTNDVTAGVGLFMPDKDAAAPYKDMFYDKDTKLPATADQMKADWVIASNILRVWRPPNLETDYPQKCQLRMRKEAALAKMDELLRSKLVSTLKPPEMSAFASLPLQAQIAIASVAYGAVSSRMPSFRKAMNNADLDRAGYHSYWDGWSTIKIKDHRILFWNAARIIEQNLDYALLPTQVKPPEMLDWKPWSQRVIELDTGTEQTVKHDTAPADFLLPGIHKDTVPYT